MNTVADIYYRDSHDNLHRVQRNGGPAVTELTYTDISDRIHTYSIPTIQNIKFAQSRAVTNKFTIRGDGRQQFGQIAPPSVTFDIKMNEALFNNLEELILDGTLVRRRLTQEEVTNVAKTSTQDIAQYVDGSSTSFTINQFISSLEQLRDEHLIFSLNTSSPLDPLLKDLAITNMSFSHDAQSREVVECTIQAKQVKFSQIGWETVEAADLLGISFSESLTELEEDQINWSVGVYFDGQTRWPDNFFTTGILNGLTEGIDWVEKHFGTTKLDHLLKLPFIPPNPAINKTVNYLSNATETSLNSTFGLRLRSYFEGDENALIPWGNIPGIDIHEDHNEYMECADPVLLDTAGTRNFGFRFHSTFYGGEADIPKDDSGTAYQYLITLPQVQVDIIDKGSAAWKPQFYTGRTHDVDVSDDNDITLMSGLYNVYYEYGATLGTGSNVQEYLDYGKVMSKIRSGTKHKVDSTNPIFSEGLSYKKAFQIDENDYIWARNLSDRYEYVVKLKLGDNTSRVVCNKIVNGDFDMFITKVSIKPEFDADFTSVGFGNWTDDVEEFWGFGEDGDTVDVYYAGYTIGARMKLFIFSKDLFGNPELIVNENTSGV